MRTNRLSTLLPEDTFCRGRLSFVASCGTCGRRIRKTRVPRCQAATSLTATDSRYSHPAPTDRCRYSSDTLGTSRCCLYP
eukprot:1875840-Rhodomonas_salina.1